MNRKLLAVFLVGIAVAGVGFQVTGVQAQQDGAGNQPTASGLTVTDLEAPESVDPGTNVTVLANVSNPTDDRQTESVEFRVAGSVVDSKLVSLAPGESKLVKLSAPTDGMVPGTYYHGVFTENDGQIAEITFSASFTLETLEAPTSIVQGGDVVVDATVTNPNNFQTTQEVVFRLAGDRVTSQSVTLGAKETSTVTFTVPTDAVESGTYVHSVFTRDDGAFAELTVEPAPATETPTETETGTDTGTETATSTDTETETATSTDTETETATSTDTETETETSTDTETETETSTDTETETETATAG